MNIDLGNNCYIFYKKNFIKKNCANELYEKLTETLDWEQKQLNFGGKIVNQPRLQCWYGEKDYFYNKILLKQREYPKIIVAIKDTVTEYLANQGINANLNGVLCNYYRDGNDYIYPHADSEKGLGPNNDNIIIVSLSFGDTRRFRLTFDDILADKREHTDPLVDFEEFELESGSLIVMYGNTQKFYKHDIPKEKNKTGRVNLTFRCMI